MKIRNGIRRDIFPMAIGAIYLFILYDFVGAIYSCHIKIGKPNNDLDSYINRKGYSIQVYTYAIA